MSPLALSLRFLQAQPDSRLVALASEGHEPAFEALVHRYRKQLFAYCRRLQPQSGAAEDALQQTLLQAWRALATGVEVREVRPWLYRIAHNVCLNNLRVRIAVPQETADARGGHDVDELVQHRLLARAALAGMAALPEVQRQAFISATLNGVSHEEVARTLGLSSGAVRGLIYRARATLRAAAAAITPNPLVHWAVRHVQTRSDAPVMAEALAGGSGAGVVAALAKGGAVLTLAGAFAGVGGVILPPTPGNHSHHHPLTRLARSAPADDGPARRGLGAGLTAARPGFAARDRTGAATAGRPASVSADERGREPIVAPERHGGSGGDSGGGTGSRAGSDGGPSGGSTSGSDGGSGATLASSSGGSPGGPSRMGEGSDGGSGGTPTFTTSGSNVGTTGGGPGPSGGGPGTTGGGPGPSGGGQVTTAQTTSDGGSGHDGGSSGSGSPDGSGGTTATSGSQALAPGAGAVQ